MPDSLPERPDLDQLRRRAKELRDAARRGDAAALERFARHHPSRASGRRLRLRSPAKPPAVAVTGAYPPLLKSSTRTAPNCTSKMKCGAGSSAQ